MAEVNTPRLMAAAKEFNIGKDTLIEYLASKGFEGEDLKPTSRITEEMYRILQVEFQTDKVAKQKAEQIDLPKNAVTDFKKRKDEQDWDCLLHMNKFLQNCWLQLKKQGLRYYL